MKLYNILRNEIEQPKAKKDFIYVMVSNLDDEQLTEVIDFLMPRYIETELKPYLHFNQMPKMDSEEFRFLVISQRYQGNVIRKIMLKENISSYYLNRFIEKYRLLEVSRGAYVFPKMIIDAQFIFQQQYSKSVISHQSALYLHGLSDVIPQKTVMSMPSNYKITQILDTNNQAMLCDDSVEVLYEGNDPIHIVNNSIAVEDISVEATSQGNPVRVTTPERTIADVLKRKHSIEEEVKIQAILRYMSEYPENRTKLRRVARTQGVLLELDSYLERHNNY